MVARPLTLYLIAGEPSGDRLGAALMAGLKSLTEVQFHGVGGPLMQAEGLQSQFPMQELSVMGIAEVLPKYFALKRRIAECAAAVRRLNPEALVTIDSPDFCLRVAALVKPQTGTIHYVAPSVWAWRPGRAAKMARVIDQVLALLPFEPPYMTAAGMGCTFVGHPVAGEPQATPTEAKAFRLRHAISPTAPLILALPGSRKGEIARLAGRFGQTLRLVLERVPTARILIPTLHSTAAFLADCTRDWPAHITLVTSASPADRAEKAAAFAAADVALAASGTVSLELAASRTPMVIGYDMAWLSRQIMAALIRTDTVTLVNLVAESRTVPEFLGARCRPEPMARALTALLAPGAARQAQLAAMDVTMQRLGQGGEAPGLRAARAVLATVRTHPLGKLPG